MSNSLYKAKPSGFKPNNNLVRVRILSIVFALLVLGGAAYVVLKRNGPPTPDAPDIAATLGTAVTSTDSSAPPYNDSPAITPATTPGFNLYTNSSYGFSLEYPADLNPQEFADEDGATILFEKDNRTGFQISITPLDQEGPLTAAAIKQSLPSLKMDNPQEVRIGGAPAIVFFSTTKSLGPTREAWFISPESPIPHGNYLYQVTGYAEFDQTLSRIMATWQFQ